MHYSFVTKISAEPLNVQEAINAVTGPSHGAIDLFIGTVRNHHEGKAVTGITYDVHRALALEVLQAICREAERTWPKTYYYVAHYQGELPVGGISVLIAVGSAHRAESFDACRYVIEEVKKRLPVWKQEHYPEGPSAWLPGHSLVAKASHE